MNFVVRLLRLEDCKQWKPNFLFPKSLCAIGTFSHSNKKKEKAMKRQHG